MEFEIIETPISFRLYGKSGIVAGERYGEVGVKLMDEMWKLVKQSRTATTGINHWVYLTGGRMLTGVELLPGAEPPDGLEPLAFELPRYLKHLHIGPYDALLAKWKALQSELASRGETMTLPSLEIYGHHCGDPAKAETTILIGLDANGRMKTA